MLNYSREQLVDLGAEITTREIHQQPQVWQAAFDSYRAHQTEIEDFIDSIDGKYDHVKVIFTGRVLQPMWGYFDSLSQKYLR